MALPLPCLQRWIAVAVLLAGISGGWAAEFRDRYLDREMVTSDRGRLEGDNTGATVEVEEPRHGGKRPSHSLWISWVAPTNGLATLQLDTVTGVLSGAPTASGAFTFTVKAQDADGAEVSREFALAVPAPLSARLTGGQLKLAWGGAANLRLERSDSLQVPSWTEVPGSLGRSEMEVPLVGDGEFFRVGSPPMNGAGWVLGTLRHSIGNPHQTIRKCRVFRRFRTAGRQGFQ